jgi:hypothetical protein
VTVDWHQCNVSGTIHHHQCTIAHSAPRHTTVMTVDGSTVKWPLYYSTVHYNNLSSFQSNINSNSQFPAVPRKLG